MATKQRHTTHHYDVSDVPPLRAGRSMILPREARVHVYPDGHVWAAAEGQLIRKSDGEPGPVRRAVFNPGDEMPDWIASLITWHTP